MCQYLPISSSKSLSPPPHRHLVPAAPPWTRHSAAHSSSVFSRLRVSRIGDLPRCLARRLLLVPNDNIRVSGSVLFWHGRFFGVDCDDRKRGSPPLRLWRLRSLGRGVHQLQVRRCCCYCCLLLLLRGVYRGSSWLSSVGLGLRQVVGKGRRRFGLDR